MQPQQPLQQTGKDIDEVTIKACLRCQKGQEEIVKESQLPEESSGYKVGKKIGIGMRISHHHHERSSYGAVPVAAVADAVAVLAAVAAICAVAAVAAVIKVGLCGLSVATLPKTIFGSELERLDTYT